MTDLTNRPATLPCPEGNMHLVGTLMVNEETDEAYVLMGAQNASTWWVLWLNMDSRGVATRDEPAHFNGMLGGRPFQRPVPSDPNHPNLGEFCTLSYDNWLEHMEAQLSWDSTERAIKGL